MKTYSFTAQVQLFLCNGMFYVQVQPAFKDQCYYVVIDPADAEQFSEDEEIEWHSVETLPEGYIFNPKENCDQC